MGTGVRDSISRLGTCQAVVTGYQTY